jgi:hypothetical protein
MKLTSPIQFSMKAWHVIAFGLFLALAACGGNHSSGIPTPPPPGGGGVVHHSFGFSAIPTHGTLHTAVNTAKEVASGWSLETSVHAQNSPTIVMTGDYNGYCPQVGAPTSNQSVGLILFGAGSLTQQSCNGNYFFGAGTDPGNAAALNTQQGALVIGSGTLQGLVIVDDATSIVGQGSGLVEVWVLRAGQVLPTGISATLGSNREVQDASDSFAVQDQDQIILTITVGPTDQINNLQWYLGKQ